MAKRKTKAEREEEQRAALRLRLGDMMAGAQGEDPDSEDFCTLFLANYPCVLEAVKIRLMTPEFWDTNTYLTAAYSADEFETVEKLTDFLYRNGVRA